MPFQFFSQLPLELRHHIWLLSLDPMQIIAKETYSQPELSDSSPERHKFRDKHSRIAFKVRPASLFFVNHEARDFFLPLPCSLPTAPAETKLPHWFSFALDSLWCMQDCMYFLVRSSWWLQLQRITVRVYCTYSLLMGERFQGVQFHFLQKRGNSFKEIDFEQQPFDEPETPEYGRHWLDEWIDDYEGWQLYHSFEFRVRVTYPGLPESKWLTPSNFVRLNHDRRKLWIGTEDEDRLSDESESGSDLDDPIRYYARKGRIKDLFCKYDLASHLR